MLVPGQGGGMNQGEEEGSGRFLGGYDAMARTKKDGSSERETKEGTGGMMRWASGGCPVYVWVQVTAGGDGEGLSCSGHGQRDSG